MSRRAYVFVLFRREQIDADKMNFGVTVLSRFRRRHFDDFARAPLQHDVAVLAQSRALLRVRLRRARCSALKVVVSHVSV